MTRYNLEGRIAIVTGDSSGLGVEFAHALAACGPTGHTLAVDGGWLAF